MVTERMGKGNNTYRDNSAFTVNITEITSTKRKIRFRVYITAGPKYIRTRVTSSVIRFMRSPVLWRL